MAKEYVEFFPKRQGRPGLPDKRTLGGGGPVILPGGGLTDSKVTIESLDGEPIDNVWVEEFEDNSIVLEALDNMVLKLLVHPSHIVGRKSTGGVVALSPSEAIAILTNSGSMWDDLRVPINSIKVSGTKPPTWTSYKGGEVLAFSDQAILGNEENVFFTIQLPHTYKEGTDIICHVHWVPEDNAGGDVYWALSYSWASVDTAFPAATTIYKASAAGTTTDAHILSTFATIDGDPAGVNFLISSMLICQLRRNSSDIKDTYTGKSAYLLEFDVHYQVDALGSTSELVK